MAERRELHRSHGHPQTSGNSHITVHPLQKDPTEPHVSLAPNGKPLSSVRKPLLEVRESTGIDFTPHDLRRTCATHLGRLGFSDLVPEVLNHKPKGVTSIYNRYRFDKEKQGALTAWAQELHRIIAVAA